MINEYLRELRLSNGCSLDDIVKAYRKRVMQVHPDKGGTAEQFVRVKLAYDWLLEHYGEDEIVETETISDTWKNWKSTLDTPEVDRYSNIEQRLYESGLGNGFKPNSQKDDTSSYQTNSKVWDGRFTSLNNVIYYVDLFYFLSGQSFEIKIPGYKTREYSLLNTNPGEIRTVYLLPENRNHNVDISITFCNKASEFVIEGTDIVYSASLDFATIYKRDSFYIPHPAKRFPLSGGVEQLRIDLPDELYSSSRIRVPGLGLYKHKNRKSQERGDLYVELVYNIPKA